MFTLVNTASYGKLERGKKMVVNSFIYQKVISVAIWPLWQHPKRGKRILNCSYKKQILAQQSFLVKASTFRISRHICFFHEVGLSNQCPQPLLHEGKTITYLGFEPGTFLGTKSVMLPTEPLRSSSSYKADYNVNQHPILIVTKYPQSPIAR
jgi:hypothetical protein